MPSTFSSYYMARSGIQTAQYNLKVTGQNMTNVNTDGYTRQRLVSNALASTTRNAMYANKDSLGIGEGVESTSVSQLRDPFLDVRYRMASTKTGMTGVQLDAMNDMESALDEISKNGINAQLTELVSELKNLAATPSDTNLETIVKTACTKLKDEFHKAAKQLEDIRTQQQGAFQKYAVDKVNTLLKNIANVNQEIKSADISQTPCLELLDQRNSYLDELSQYLDIDISTRQYSIGAGRTVDVLVVDMKGADGTNYNLIDDDQYSTFSVKQNVSVDYVTSPHNDVYYTKNLDTAVYLTNSKGDLLGKKAADGTTTLPLNDQIASGEFAGYLSMLNDNGEYDIAASGTSANGDTYPAVAATTRGIGYYQKTLDKLAGAFAQMMNNVNSTNVTLDDMGNNASNLPNKPLFTTDDGITTDISQITAKNISISNAWNSAVGNFITATKSETLVGVDNSSAGKNILYMINQFTQEKTFYTDSTKTTTLFTSSLDSFMSTLSTTLGQDINTTSNQNTSFTLTRNDIDTQRQAISSVDINEESINMIMYNQALAASSRFMTTLDEAIDTIINKMGVG